MDTKAPTNLIFLYLWKSNLFSYMIFISSLKSYWLSDSRYMILGKIQCLKCMNTIFKILFQIQSITKGKHLDCTIYSFFYKILFSFTIIFCNARLIVFLGFIYVGPFIQVFSTKAFIFPLHPFYSSKKYHSQVEKRVTDQDNPGVMNSDTLKMYIR